MTPEEAQREIERLVGELNRAHKQNKELQKDYNNLLRRYNEYMLCPRDLEDRD